MSVMHMGHVNERVVTGAGVWYHRGIDPTTQTLPAIDLLRMTHYDYIDPRELSTTEP